MVAFPDPIIICSWMYHDLLLSFWIIWTLTHFYKHLFALLSLVFWWLDITCCLRFPFPRNDLDIQTSGPQFLCCRLARFVNTCDIMHHYVVTFLKYTAISKTAVELQRNYSSGGMRLLLTLMKVKVLCFFVKYKYAGLTTFDVKYYSPSTGKLYIAYSVYLLVRFAR
jgi:hypothetical protein